MKYAYEDLSPDQFEDLVVCICWRLLGYATQGFSTGPDGGRDARFVGTANLLPSERAPWTGSTIIQAKHTMGINKSFSESEFFSLNGHKSVIATELPRIANLSEIGDLNNYILFSNRKLSANAESKIRRHISCETGIAQESIFLVGVEAIEMFLKRFPEITNEVRIDPVDSPLNVSPDDLSIVIESLNDFINISDSNSILPPTQRTPYATKNKINNLTPNYAKSFRDRFLKETGQIDKFLSAPENTYIYSLYQNAVEEFELKIIAKRKDYQTFDDVLNRIFDLLLKRDPVLAKHKRLTRAIVFYMYWTCDIGQNKNDTA